jgi:predicted transcriptional regulator
MQKATKGGPRMDKKTREQIEEKRKLPLQERLYRALQSPLRTKMLAYMNDRAWSPRELATELDEGLSQVAYHVKVLHEYGLIELARTEPVRGATEHFYIAVYPAYIPPSLAKHIPKSGRAAIVGDILEEIDKDVGASMQSRRFFSRDDDHASWTQGDLDEVGCKEASELADEFLERFLAIGGKAAVRRANEEGDGEHIAISAALLVFPSELGEQLKAASRKRHRGRPRKR